MEKKKPESDLLDQKFLKSNALISSKFQSTVLENKVLNTALAKIEQDPAGHLFAKLNVREFYMEMDGKVPSAAYTTMKQLAQRMQRRIIFVENAEEKKFASIVLVPSVLYDNGIMTINFNNDPLTTALLTNLKGNFTVLDRHLMCGLKSNASFRIYEILKSQSFDRYDAGKPAPKRTDPKDPYIIEFDLAELMVSIGLVDLASPVAQSEMGKKKPDFNAIIKNAAPEEIMYSNWRDFRRNVLDVAKGEINEKMDLGMDYEPIKHGRGGTVIAVRFKTWFKKEYENEENPKTRVQMIDLSQDPVDQDLREMKEIPYSETDLVCEPGLTSSEIFTAESPEKAKKETKPARPKKEQTQKKKKAMQPSSPVPADKEPASSASTDSSLGFAMLYNALITSVKDITEGKLADETCLSLLLAANGNLDKIKSAYQMAMESGTDIRNLAGWLLDAIKKEYQEPVSSKAVKRTRKNSFQNFEERTVDYDELLKRARESD